jgi:hypothetical protein
MQMILNYTHIIRVNEDLCIVHILYEDASWFGL